MKPIVTQILFAAAMAALPVCTNAQINNVFSCSTRQKRSGIPIGHSNKANKTTATIGSRLIAFTQWIGDKPTDSITYNYDGTMGGYPNNPYGLTSWQWNYDSSYTYTYNVTAGSYYSHGYITLQTFNAENNLAFSMGQSWNLSTSAWTNSWKTTFTYNAINLPTVALAQTWNSVAWVNSYEYVYTYSDSLLTEKEELQWNTTTNSWDSIYAYVYAYDATSHVITEIDKNWNTSTGTWLNSSQAAYTYDGSGNMLAQFDYVWDTSASAWVNNYNYIYSDFVDQQPQMVIERSWDKATSAWVNMQKHIITYNSYSQPIVDSTQFWNAITSAWESDGAAFWYYETYTTSVQNISASNGKATIYPVPAINVLSISVDWDAPQAFTVAITDMMGRVCSTWNIAECSKYNTSVSVANLAAGNYIVSMMGSKGKVVQQLTVVK